MDTTDAKDFMASPFPDTPATMEKNPRERQLQDDGENQKMDRNTMGPRKKKPKKKKFMPKVIREGTSIRKPKKMPANTKGNGSVKRKENSSVKGKDISMKSPTVKRVLRFQDDQVQNNLNETPCTMSIGIQSSHADCFDLKEDILSRKYIPIKKPRSQTARRNMHFGDDKKRHDLNGTPCLMSRGTKRNLADLLPIHKKKKRTMIVKEESINGWRDISLLQNVSGGFTLGRKKHDKLVQIHNSIADFCKFPSSVNVPQTPEKSSGLIVYRRRPSTHVKHIQPLIPEKFSGYIVYRRRHSTLCIKTTSEGEGVLLCDEKEKKGNELVQANSSTTSTFIEDHHKASSSIKPSKDINVDCVEPQIVEKVYKDDHNQDIYMEDYNQEDRVHEPVHSENYMHVEAHLPPSCSSYEMSIHCPPLCSSNEFSISELLYKDLHNQSLVSCSNNLDDKSYGPQARIELLVAKQVRVRGTRCGRKGKNLQIIPWHNSFESRKSMLNNLDHIIQRLRHLNINSVREGGAIQLENALVPLARVGMIVAVKQKPRAKVDLDPDSNRMWELLMGNESANVDGGATEADKDKEKWWEEERRVFYGRVDSFIAKMELILGDRQFSPWKGSVVDSVVGVFLTQNVSDHLSSSAFMSLAARFPLRSEGNKSRPINAEESLSASQPASCSDSCSPPSQNSDEPIALSKLEDCAKMHSCCQRVACICIHLQDGNTTREIEVKDRAERTLNAMETQTQQHTCGAETCLNTENASRKASLNSAEPDFNLRSETCTSQHVSPENLNNTSKYKKENVVGGKEAYDWDRLRRETFQNGVKKDRSDHTKDSLDYEAVRCADNKDVACAIRERGQNNNLAMRIKDFLNRIVKDHGSIDLEWLRDVAPDKAKDFLLSIDGLGIKSVECVRLLALQHQAFPVDTNVGRICVRLGWVPLQPLPDSLQLHLLEMYPVQETIQKYLWPRLCKLDHETLYKLHYLLIAFGKVFCTKSKPNCNACPMRGGCKHFASAFASARLALPRPGETSLASATIPNQNPNILPALEGSTISQHQSTPRDCEPIIELPASPEPTVPQNFELIDEYASLRPDHKETIVTDIEDFFCDDSDGIPTIDINTEEFTQNILNYIQETNMELQEGDMSKALVSLTPEVASIPMPKLKNASRLRTTHQAYELEDSSPLLEGLEKRDPDDHSPYLLAIWTPGETSQSTEPPKACCDSQDGKMCDKNTCFSCNNMREAQAGTVRGTLLIPCRTANRGSFPLNGTYFQVNEVFADHYTSLNPIDVPRQWIWSLKRSTVFFGTSVSAMLKDLTTEDVQHCFWRGYVCVRAFDRETRTPKPLCPRFHFSISMAIKNKEQKQQNGKRSAPGRQKAKGINVDDKQAN